MKRVIICLIIVSLFLLPFTANAVSAESYILMEADTGKVLMEHNADSRMLIASITKIMTALVTLEQVELTETVEIPYEAANVEGSSMYLKEGEIRTIEELLYGLLLVSGNDAATALAIYVAGGEAEFAELMNEKASELGLKNTSFTNPHGLDHENHYSTARDMAVIMAAAMENEDFVRINSTHNITMNELTYINHNKLLWECEGVIGGKTGYTVAAGRTLVTCCERNGMRLICVTLNDADDWTDHMSMYDEAFSKYKRVDVINDSDVYGSVSIVTGEEYIPVPVKAAESVTLVVGINDTVETSAELPRFAYAGIHEGDVCGSIKWTVNGKEEGSVDLIYTESIERVEPEEEDGIFERIKDFFKGIIEYNLQRFGYYGD